VAWQNFSQQISGFVVARQPCRLWKTTGIACRARVLVCDFFSFKHGSEIEIRHNFFTLDGDEEVVPTIAVRWVPYQQQGDCDALTLKNQQVAYRFQIKT